MSNELEKFILDNRDAFDHRHPNPAVLDKIHAQLKAEKNKRKSRVISIKAIRWAAACLVVITGASVFFFRQSLPDTDLVKVNPPGLVSDPGTPAPESTTTNDTANTITAAIEPLVPETEAKADFTAQKQAVFAKLNNMQSPAQRIMAAERAYELSDKTDRDIVDALVKTMNEDPSTNVRLAALDALGKFHRQPYVKKQLVTALKKQKDPFVQIELIKMLTQMKQASVLRELEKIAEDENTIKAVKDHAYAGILHLKS